MVICISIYIQTLRQGHIYLIIPYDKSLEVSTDRVNKYFFVENRHSHGWCPSRYLQDVRSFDIDCKIENRERDTSLCVHMNHESDSRKDFILDNFLFQLEFIPICKY